VNRHRLAAVVPALNEVAAISDVVAGLHTAGACCVYVVDGNSSDGTPEAALEQGAIVLSQPGPGYGRACATGLRAAANHELIAILDGDGSCNPADLAELLTASASADLVLGWRTKVAPSSMPWHAWLGNQVITALLQLRTGRRIHDLGPFKLLHSRALQSLAIDEPGYGWTVELVSRALTSPWLRVCEVPVSFRPRRGGKSKVSGDLRASIRAAQAMLGRALTATHKRGLLIVMAKAPRAGHSKTRLTAQIGEDAALRFWRACLRDIGTRMARAARQADVDVIAMVPSSRDAVVVGELTGLPCLVQNRPGLGHALAEGFEQALALSRPYAAVVSSDVPTIPEELIGEAMRLLQRGRTVVGPGRDGGYYLLGLPLPRGKSKLAQLFLEMPLGGSQILEHTRSVLPGAIELPAWTDVDEVEELRWLAGELSANPELAPTIADCLSGQRV
jgi:glycosyltransferase A (GT-A) superfamily protein (DUF2064 family)